ncbi:MAG: T9SS type A sorting domain-containing protein [Paraprevotella sp.]|nr:T9SS type A sorting domain-containing protein [Paraprevotella sp.]
MKAKYILFPLLAIFLLSTPRTAFAQTEKDGIEAETNNITLTANGSTIHVANANGLTLEVYNITGVCIASHQIENNDATINLSLKKGYYLLKINNIVRKISIR